MKLGIRAKLFLFSVGLITLSVFIAYGYLRAELEAVVLERIEDDLQVRAQLVAGRAGEHRADLDDVASWDALADSLGQNSEARITLIRHDGKVLGDSGVATDALEAVENHRGRPEVTEALAGHSGVARRHSATVGQDLLYVALPFRREGEIAGAARVALRLTVIDAAIARLRDVLTVAFVIALVVAVAMSSLAAELMSRSARLVTQTARRMAQGDLEVRTNVAGDDELADLGRALDQLAGNLSASLEELQAESERLEGILSGMQEGVLLVDREGRIAMVNPALRNMLLLPSEAVGKTPSEVLRHDELIKLVELVRDTQESASAEIGVRGLKPRRLLVDVAPLAHDAATTLGVVFDVTDIRRLETLRRDFVANVSHELRTPVTSIQSAAETLKVAARKDPKAAESFIDMIERNAERLRALVEDLLTLSRIESQQFRLTIEPIDLEPIIAHAIDTFAERATREKIELRVDSLGDVPHVSADSRAVEHVLTNLVENAVKYSGEGASVVVSARKENGVVRVRVTDTGRGIDAEHLPRLFERFYRADPGRSREQGGTGLGLAIVKHLVEAMGGAVAVDSTVGLGSEFSFTLATASRRKAVDAA